MSAGPVIAGVVGAQKPLYDIWGNTVNVASRMDYTGVLGKIQCPDEVAECLERDGITCSYRDIIFVKGKGNMRTHFVNLTEDNHVMKKCKMNENHRYIFFKSKLIRHYLFLWYCLIYYFTYIGYIICFSLLNEMLSTSDNLPTPGDNISKPENRIDLHELEKTQGELGIDIQRYIL